MKKSNANKDSQQNKTSKHEFSLDEMKESDEAFKMNMCKVI